MALLQNFNFDTETPNGSSESVNSSRSSVLDKSSSSDSLIMGKQKTPSRHNSYRIKDQEAFYKQDTSPCFEGS